jgi:hypothetical protein
VQEINLSLARSPGSAATLDGMGISPAETAQALLARLKGSGNDQLVARLEEALAPIDPELLRPRGE